MFFFSGLSQKKKSRRISKYDFSKKSFKDFSSYSFRMDLCPCTSLNVSPKIPPKMLPGISPGIRNQFKFLLGFLQGLLRKFLDATEVRLCISSNIFERITPGVFHRGFLRYSRYFLIKILQDFFSGFSLKLSKHFQKRCNSRRDVRLFERFFSENLLRSSFRHSDIFPRKSFTHYCWKFFQRFHQVLLDIRGYFHSQALI